VRARAAADAARDPLHGVRQGRRVGVRYEDQRALRALWGGLQRLRPRVPFLPLVLRRGVDAPGLRRARHAPRRRVRQLLGVDVVAQRALHRFLPAAAHAGFVETRCRGLSGKKRCAARQP
jgi:hypothetical protein